MSERVRAGAILGMFLAGAAGARAADYKPSEETLAFYKAKCQQCHMADGNSPLEPLNFVDGKWTHGSSVEEIGKIISDGAPGTAMLSFKAQFTPEEIAGLARYVRSFDKAPLKPEAGGKKTAKPASPKADKSR
jgi:cytochrome c oxidase cbb3-type subunit III